MNEIIAKLTAIHNYALKIQNIYPSTFPREEIDRLYARLIHIDDKIKNFRPDLFDDFSICTIEKYLVEDKTRYFRAANVKICLDLTYYLDTLNYISNQSIPNISVTKEGIFFAGQYFDALMKIGEIIEEAKNEIILIDSYLDEKIIHFIKSKNANASLSLVTYKKTLTEGFKSFIDAAEKQYGKLRFLQNDSFHDRFVVIDRAVLYHFGASLKDVGKRGFMFSVVEEESMKLAFLNKLESLGI
jgi:hypothetical protein